MNAVVAHFQRVAQRQLADLARQQLQKGLEVLGIEFLGAHELPVDRAEAILQLDQSLRHETLHRFTRVGQHAPVGAEARGLDREHEPVGRVVVPLGPARGLEARIVGAVDLDRGELAAGIFQLALLREVFRIEDAAPWLEGPAADADKEIFSTHGAEYSATLGGTACGSCNVLRA